MFQHTHHLSSKPVQATESITTESITTDLLGTIDLFLCHELRTPLTSIHGALKLLNTGQLGSLSYEGEQVLAIAIRNANRLIRLADALENKPNSSMVILSETAIEQLQLENQLHEALDRQEIEVVYQPIVSTGNHTILGFEALAQWRHPHKGVISPTVFIPLAERLGLIHLLGLQVLQKACYRLAQWQQQFPNTLPLTISVNLSGLQLSEPSLIEDIRQVLETAGILPNSLKLEITESALIENQERAIAVLSELKTMGVQLYIDDFGTGYSSLGRLQNFPIDALKLDRSFVQGQQWDISEMIILLASRLGLGVIAEGVETVEELRILQRLGCKQIQGYFFSKPVGDDAATALLRTRYCQPQGYLVCHSHEQNSDQVS